MASSGGCGQALVHGDADQGTDSAAESDRKQLGAVDARIGDVLGSALG